VKNETKMAMDVSIEELQDPLARPIHLTLAVV
jgi:hypothetical protein